jgi:hypothetical protein
MSAYQAEQRKIVWASKQNAAASAKSDRLSGLKNPRSGQRAQKKR